MMLDKKCMSYHSKVAYTDTVCHQRSCYFFICHPPPNIINNRLLTDFAVDIGYYRRYMIISSYRSALWTTLLLSPAVYMLKFALGARVKYCSRGNYISAHREQSALLMPRLRVLSDPVQSSSSLPNRVAFPPIIHPCGSSSDLMYACMISAIWFSLHS